MKIVLALSSSFVCPLLFHHAAFSLSLSVLESLSLPSLGAPVLTGSVLEHITGSVLEHICEIRVEPRSHLQSSICS